MKTKMQLLLLFALLVSAWGEGAQVVFADSGGGYLETNTSDQSFAGVIDTACQSKCGDLTVPYPFGITSKGGGLNCSRNPGFDITCNYSTNPPKAFIKDWTMQIFNISESQLRVSNFVARRCYINQSGPLYKNYYAQVDLYESPYTLSSTDNVFTVVGCDDRGSIYQAEDNYGPNGCSTACYSANEVIKDECLGTGCCQVSVKVRKYIDIYMGTYNNHTKNTWTYNPCGYAFLGEKNRFNFSGLSDLNDTAFMANTMDTVPIVLDWVIDENRTCAQAKDSDNYACIHANTLCINGSSGGYLCSCQPGYEGNPYLRTGCHDIDECADPKKNDCEATCNNMPAGNYTCSCPHGSHGDGRKSGSGCAPDQRSKPRHGQFNFVIGIAVSSIFLILGSNWLYCINKKRNHAQLREKFFQKNGGLLLKQHASSEGVTIEATIHFTDEELKKATNNYASNRILGQGGYGVVFKGILPDQRVVAIKKSKIIDDNQIEQFINEMRILTQVNHRNVVKLLGCCLECEVPLLVYEFVSNGTLLEHVHNVDGGESWLSLDNRLRIAAESSGALAYLHSAASIPIIHRDVKLANILLDDHHVAKIADFGASRLVPLDQTQVTTLVQGTLGYLDPEYFQTGQLTDKSDVYSFGVVLAELLTGRNPICMERCPQDRNLATYFITSVKENKYFQILEPRVLKEGTIEQLEAAAHLVKRCLSIDGDKRPTMKEVTTELENLRKFTKHPWADQHGHEDTASLISSKTEHSDLYEIQLSSNNNIGHHSEQYSSGTASLLLPSSSPR